MSTPSACPVCSRKPEEQVRCTACGFEQAFISGFADPAALQLWQSQVLTAQQSRRTLSLGRLRGKQIIACSSRTLAVINPDTHDCRFFNKDGNLPSSPRLHNAQQVSCSRNHHVTLHADGTLTPYVIGNLRDVQDAAFVHSTENATYIITRQGRIVTRGLSEFQPIIDSWTDVTQLACSDTALIALLRDGTVRIAATTAADADIRRRPLDPADTALCREYAAPLDWRGITQVAAAGQYLLGLTNTGKTLYLGRLSTRLWQEPVICIAAARDYALGLTEDGRVLTAGKRQTTLAPDLASETAAWRDVLVLAAHDTTVCGIDAAGQLLIAGSSYYRSSLIDRRLWDASFLVS